MADGAPVLPVAAARLPAAGIEGGLQVQGLAGDDLFVMDDNSATTMLDGGEGSDAASYRFDEAGYGITAGITFDLSSLTTTSTPTQLADGRGGIDRAQVGHLRQQVRSLSPQSTLDRGYSVVRDLDGHVISDAAKVKKGQQLKVRLAKGELGAVAE